MLESLFRFLFEYRPVIFQQGDFRLAPTAGSFVAAALAALAAVAVILTYRQVRAKGRTRDRIVLTTLRLATLALLLFCLFRPVLVVKAAVSQQNFLAVLIDDSRSMQITDFGTRPRSAFVSQAFGDPASGVMKGLADKFVLRTFRFSSSASRLGSPRELSFAGGHSRIGAALDGVRQELAGLPLAGVVLVTDGADTTDAALPAAGSEGAKPGGVLADTLLSLKAAAVPVFTVGVGRDRLARDVQIDRVSTPRRALKGTSLVTDVVITQTGYAGETVSLIVEDDGRIVGTQAVKLPADGEPAAVRARFIASDAGSRLFKFRIAPRPGELVTQNNARDALIDVRDMQQRILYFEGEPRPEMKFINRAVADDKNLHVITLQRTADNKYLRLNVDTPDQLLAGFPKTREELFGYDGLILGSIEAGAFTGDQLRMIAEFVERRGGGLLMLGGPRSFGEGNYGGTPIADVLPVTFDRLTRESDDYQLARLQVRPTRAGEAHGVTQIATTEAQSAERWKDLPVLTSLNAITGLKPGATVLLSGGDERRRDHAVLAFQRYGRGKAIAFPVQDSWHWQMDVKMSVEDLTHENYWRQLLRWLVDGVPGVVDVHTLADRVDPGEQLTIVADVVDRAFVELNDARVVAHVTDPKGGELDVPMQWTGERSGEYRGVITAKEAGAYSARVEAFREGSTLGAGSAQFRAAPGDAEYFDATMHAARLRRIAEETGGRFYTTDNVAGLPEDVRYAGRGVTTVEERELWHMPVVLMLMVGLVCAEWGYRRAVGLA